MKIDMMKSQSMLILFVSTIYASGSVKPEDFNQETGGKASPELPDTAEPVSAPVKDNCLPPQNQVGIPDYSQLYVFESVTLDAFNILAQQRSFAVFRKFLSNRKVVWALKEFFFFFITSRDEITKAISVISHETTVGHIYSLVHKDLRAVAYGDFTFGNTVAFLEPYAVVHPVIYHVIRHIRNLNKAVFPVDLSLDNYDEKESQGLFRLFLINAHESGKDIPFLNPTVEATLTIEQRRTLQKQFISHIDKNLYAPVEHYRLINAIHKYFDNLSHNVCLLLNGILEAGVKRNRKNFNVFFDALIVELKMLYLDKYN